MDICNNLVTHYRAVATPEFISTKNHIEIELFLQALYALRPIYECMFGKNGRVSTVLLNDLNGNIKTVEQVYEKCKVKGIKTLVELVKVEKEVTGKTAVQVALLWLSRTLLVIDHFVMLVKEQNASPGQAAKVAYAKELGPFHGWFIATFVGIVLPFLPQSRDKLRESLGFKSEEEAVKELNVIYGALDPVTKKLDAFVKDQGIYNEDKVNSITYGG
jgi:Glycolipid transfer protein (GLTP)